jgi:hypothetical protein
MIFAVARRPSPPKTIEPAPKSMPSQALTNSLPTIATIAPNRINDTPATVTVIRTAPFAQE